jgi:hypothetical protein
MDYEVSSIILLPLSFSSLNVYSFHFTLSSRRHWLFLILHNSPFPVRSSRFVVRRSRSPFPICHIPHSPYSPFAIPTHSHPFAIPTHSPFQFPTIHHSPFVTMHHPHKTNPQKRGTQHKHSSPRAMSTQSKTV